MENFYSVTRKGKACGKVSVKKQGLYYRFQCRCMIDDQDIYRLNLTCGDFQKNLGVLVPAGDSFELTARIPVKQLPEGDWIFLIQSRLSPPEETFVPISPEEPFAYISRLKDSFLTHQNGQPGITVENLEEIIRQ